MAFSEKWERFRRHRAANLATVQIFWSEEIGEVERLIWFAEAPGLAWWVRRIPALPGSIQPRVIAMRIWFN